jgi:hypothetical protein
MAVEGSSKQQKERKKHESTNSVQKITNSAEAPFAEISPADFWQYICTIRDNSNQKLKI